MILIYNGKKKGSANKLFMNRLYAKDFTIIDDEDFADGVPYDAYEETVDEDDDAEYEPVSELELIIEKGEQ